MHNQKTKLLSVGGVALGGGSGVKIQSMTTTKTADVEKTAAQISALEKAGCEIIRVAVSDEADALAIRAVKEKIHIPLVADIHFSPKLAVMAIESGADKVRINPGNIGDESRVKEVATACKNAGVPIRIGVNSGSLEKEILAKYGSPTPEAMVESGFYHISLLEKFDFDDIVLSLKSSDTKRMYEAYVLAAQKCKYPLHLGVTEAGTERLGVIKSAAGIGGLLLRGIGSTIRISLTDDPVLEVKAAKDLLKALDMRKGGIKFVSCPTCGRTSIDLIGLAKAAEERFSHIEKDITVAIMGCVVNGPGEAREADLGIAGGNGEGLLFKHGQILRKVPEKELLDALEEEINSFN